MKILPCGAIVDDDVYEWAKHFNWRIHSGYAAIRQSEKTVFLHKVVINANDDQMIDHRDRNRLNCLRENLRFATHSENAINRNYGNRGESLYRGVSIDRRYGKWRAAIQKDKKRVALGYFPDEISAARAYDDAAKEIHGEFAVLNFPEAQ